MYILKDVSGFRLLVFVAVALLSSAPEVHAAARTTRVKVAIDDCIERLSRASAVSFECKVQARGADARRVLVRADQRALSVSGCTVAINATEDGYRAEVTQDAGNKRHYLSPSEARTCLRRAAATASETDLELGSVTVQESAEALAFSTGE
jgi:hypothetical protein